MKGLLIVSTIIALSISTPADAAKRKKVYINKPSPPEQLQNVPLIAVPPALVAFDLIRRTSCDPRIAVSTGKGDPGFDLVNGPLYGNFLVPAIYRKECQNQPQPKR